ncbi:MAG: putative dimethyl sulfoxide reductase chaperone [Clostridia bacterium]|nr:putative dimethyl sulfoxide reductase chaperone [Clostridia bacterium]MDN5323491.1 putative dimethyl sulfoxide reductase chaperone [Clostridia bacterium]
MPSLVMRRQEAVAEIFLIFAEFFKYPSRSFFDDLKWGNVDNQLKILFKTANFNLGVPNFYSFISEFSELKSTYARCFLGITKPFALPIESVYKTWTTDPTVKLPIANSKGYVMGDSAMHILHLFEHFQLEIPEEYGMMPDHLTILLELYAFMIGKRSPKECEIFIKDHFNWLDDFKDALYQVKESGFYLYVLDTLQKVIREEQCYLEG